MEKINISIECPFCDNTSVVTVNAEDYRKYQEGEYVQHAFPYLSIVQREMFISHMCADCQRKFFG